jgi:uncharacterized membrane protein
MADRGDEMDKGRLAAFSDGVIAILMTIMVFDIKPPLGTDWAALRTVLPVLLTYSMSFLYLGIYWNNHHHLLMLTQRINGGVLWANSHLMFWLSLLPFATNWLWSSGFEGLPAAVYGVVLSLAAVAYTLLQSAIISVDGKGSQLSQAVGRDIKGKVSIAAYLLGIAISFRWPPVAVGIYVCVALIWLVPDQRLEARLTSRSSCSEE